MATVSIRMPDDMKEALERLATEKSMTVSGLISERINDMLGTVKRSGRIPHIH